jgi:MoaA/NifB/PqqE/SkfB family radical SAM enzyme
VKLATMLKAGTGVLQGYLSGRYPPLFLILSVTNRCLSHCRYCKIPDRRQRELSTAEIGSLLKQAAALGTQRLGIWGGEPLVREDIGEIIHQAKALGLYVTLDSNGYLVPERLKDLRELDHLIISFDGPEAAHDANREPGSHAKVMRALEAATPHHKVWTITVLTKHNLDSLDYIFAQAERLGLVTTFQLLHHNPNLGKNDELLPSPEEYRAVLDKLIQAKRAGKPIGTSYLALQHLRRWQDYREIKLPRHASPFHCWAGKFYFNVDSDGSVYPCSLLVDDVPHANFLEHGLAAALRALPALPCDGCLATCYTEYNSLFSMNLSTIWEWMLAMRKWGK